MFGFRAFPYVRRGSYLWIISLQMHTHHSEMCKSENKQNSQRRIIVRYKRYGIISDWIAAHILRWCRRYSYAIHKIQTVRNAIFLFATLEVKAR